MSETTRTDIGKGVTITDFGQPERLDGAEMQFMVTDESGRLGCCLAYFGTQEDAELFALAKVAQSQLEEPPLGGDEVSAELNQPA
jgi:hypothetical protein